MAGESTILDVPFDNVAGVNFQPYQVAVVDASNSGVLTTAATTPGAALAQPLGVVYDKAKLDGSGNPVANSGANIRLLGIARVIANAAITPGALVAISGTNGRVQPATKSNAPFTLSAALTPAIVAANTSAEQTFNPAGFASLLTTDVVVVNKPTAQAGLGIVGARVSAAGTLAITFGNFTGSGITPTAAETYLVAVFRGAGVAGGTPILGIALSQAQAAGDRIVVLLTPGVQI